MSHFAGIDHFSKHPHSADDSSSCSSGPDYSHSDPAYCHPEANSVLSGYSIDSWAPYFYPIKAHRVITGPSSHRADYTPWGADYRKDRGIHPEHSDICSWAIIFTSSSYHYLIIYLVSFLYFFTIVELVIPCFLCFVYWDWLYYLFSFVMYFPEGIQIYNFFEYSWHNFIIIPLLISFIIFETCGFSYSTRTSYHSGDTTSSLFFNRSCHIEDNVQLGWGELRKEVFVINAKLFW